VLRGAFGYSFDAIVDVIFSKCVWDSGAFRGFIHLTKIGCLKYDSSGPAPSNEPPFTEPGSG
jgi:hypothetical protein